jgi:hypothetical protein
MNLRKLLVYQKKIMGVEVDNQRLRLVNLTSGKTAETLRIKQITEVKLVPHVVESGEVQDEEKLHFAFQQLRKEFLRSRGKGRMNKRMIPIILSIPSTKIYSQLFRFPKYLSPDQLKESMNLSTNFSLPQPKEEIYFDWQKAISSKEKGQAAFLFSIEKPIVDAYLRAIIGTGFIPLVLESHALSLCRIVSRIDQDLLILALINEEGVDLIVSEQGSPRFIHSVIWPTNQKSKKEFLEQEIWKVANFYQTDPRENNLKINKIYLISNQLNLSSFRSYLAKKPSRQVIILETKPWIRLSGSNRDKKEIFLKSTYLGAKQLSKLKSLVVLGAGLRGLIPRKGDTAISLLPVGTEKEYDNQLTISFLDFISFWILGISIITLLLLGGTYKFISNVNQDLEIRLNQSHYIPLSLEVEKMQQEMVQFNKNIDLMHSSIEGQSTPLISELLVTLANKKMLGIVFNRIQVFSRDNILLEGKAETRTQLLKFKDELVGADFFSEVELPLKFLVRENHLTFTINLKLK